MERSLISSGAGDRQSAVLYFFSKVFSVASNTFIESVRQPVFAVIVASAAALIAISPYITMFTLQQTPRFVTDMGLATLLLSGLLLGAFTASNVIAHEIENKTVLTVISKPVGRAEFVLGKFLGVMAGIGVGMYVLTLVLVLSVSGGALEADIEQELSLSVVFSIFGCMFLSVCYGLYSNYFHDRPFPSRAIGAAVVCFTLAFLVLMNHDPRALKDNWGFLKGIDLKVVFACIMAMWAVFVLASIAIAASTRLTVVVNIALCSGVFLLGLLSNYLFRDLAAKMAESSAVVKIAANVLYTVVPNLQFFWISDYLNTLGVVPTLGNPVVMLGWLTVFTGIYALLQVGAYLFLAMLLFQERQVA